MCLSKNQPKISVIVPVYNVEKFLPKCLNSIANQTLTDIEVILINDGSTDSSKDILESYAKLNPKFKVTNKANEGVTNTRNLGIQKAKGKYIAFIDSDDFVHSNFLHDLYYLAEESNTEIACCNYYKYNLKTGVKYTHQTALKAGIYDNKQALNTLINDNRLQYYIWNKIFLRSMIVENNINFPNMCFEDTDFSIRSFYYANTVAVTRKPLYYYCKHSESTIAQIGLDKINDYLLALASTRNFLEQENVFDFYKKSYFTHSLRIYCSTIKLILQAQGLNQASIANLAKMKDAIFYYNSNKFKPVESIEDLRLALYK